MEQQQHGFSDSTPRAGSDGLQKSAKSLLIALQLMSISQISTQTTTSKKSFFTIKRHPENFEIPYLLISNPLEKK